MKQTRKCFSFFRVHNWTHRMSRSMGEHSALYCDGECSSNPVKSELICQMYFDKDPFKLSCTFLYEVLNKVSFRYIMYHPFQCYSQLACYDIRSRIFQFLEVYLSVSFLCIDILYSCHMSHKSSFTWCYDFVSLVLGSLEFI